MLEKANQGLKRIQGRMLIAMPHMADPRFYKTTSAVLKHDASGASAVIFNKITRGLLFEQICLDLGYKCIMQLRATPIYYGGPVNNTQVFVFHSNDYHDKDTMKVTDGIAVTSNKNLVQLISEGNGPKKFKIAVGCAMWIPEQLDDELDGAWPRRGIISWLHDDLIADDVFSTKDCWSEAIDDYSSSITNDILSYMEKEKDASKLPNKK